jgi:putative membrane protein
VRVRRRGRVGDAGWDRALLFGLAIAAGLFGLVGLHEPAERLASGHMLQHVLIGDIAVALALTALRGPLWQAFLPRPLRRLARRRAMRALLRPGPSLAVFALLLWTWHVPALYGLALANPVVHMLQHASFVVGAFLIWFQLIDPARRRLLGLWGSLGYAFGVMLVGQVLVSVMILSYRPIYPTYAHTPGTMLGLSPLADQNLAGLIMALEMFFVLGTYTVIRLRTYVRDPLVLREGHPLGA